MIKVIKIFLLVVILGGAALYFFSHPPVFFKASERKPIWNWDDFFTTSSEQPSVPTESTGSSWPSYYTNTDSNISSQ